METTNAPQRRRCNASRVEAMREASEFGEMSLTQAQHKSSSLTHQKPKCWCLALEIFMVRCSRWANGVMWKQSINVSMSLVSIGGGASASVQWRCMMFGGETAVIGRSSNPSSSKQACVATLTRDVSGSHQRIFRVVHGTCPRKMPRQELGMSFAACFPGGAPRLATQRSRSE